MMDLKMIPNQCCEIFLTCGYDIFAWIRTRAGELLGSMVSIKPGVIIYVFWMLMIGFTGCGIVIPPVCTTATVYITTPNDSWTYWIYIDDYFWGTTNSYGSMTLYNVPTGYHKFYALSNDYEWDGTVYATINCGTNNVPIYTYDIFVF